MNVVQKIYSLYFSIKSTVCWRKEEWINKLLNQVLALKNDCITAKLLLVKDRNLKKIGQKNSIKFIKR